MPEFLTPDNFQLSRPTNAPISANSSSATDCNLPSYLGFVRYSLSPATQVAYLGDIHDFETSGGAFPATAEQIAIYLADQSTRLSPATLERRLAAISKAHDARGLPNPVRSKLVRATMRGIKRTCGTAQREAAPLLKEDLFDILARMGDRPKDIRDQAILLIGFAGAFRRSELVALDREDMESVRQGLVLTIRRSKTDQLGQGRKIGVPHGRTRWCPVAALERWLALANIQAGPMFRRIDRHGNILAERSAPETVSLIVKERVADIGLEAARYSGHSLRSGLATSAAMAGISTWAIRKTTGHRSDQMLNRYIRDGSLFTDNAAAALL